MPEGVVTASVCRISGLRPTQGCIRMSNTYTEFFVRGTVPANYCEECMSAATQAPTIRLNGRSSITLTVGEEYIEQRSNSNRRV